MSNFYFFIFLWLMWEFLCLECERGGSVCWSNNKIIDIFEDNFLLTWKFLLIFHPKKMGHNFSSCSNIELCLWTHGLPRKLWYIHMIQRLYTLLINRLSQVWTGRITYSLFSAILAFVHTWTCSEQFNKFVDPEIHFRSWRT